MEKYLPPFTTNSFNPTVKTNFKVIFKVTFLSVILSTTLFGQMALAKESSATLTIMETSDLHENFVDYDYYSDRPNSFIGLARTASLINEIRKEFKNTLLVDNGDLLQGTPLGDYVARVQTLDHGEIHPAYKAMNLLQYDLATLGNHEFNYGLDFLQKALKGANFPYVSTNVVYDDGQSIDKANTPSDRYLVKPYVIIKKELITEDGDKLPIKIGFLGFVPPQIMQWDAAHLKGKLKTYDIIDSAKVMVEQLKKEGVDLIVVLSHSGIDATPSQKMPENASYYLTQLPSIDAVFTGHEHKIFPSSQFEGMDGVDLEKGTIHGVPVAMPGYGGNNLGYITLNLTKIDDGKWHVLSGTGHTRAIYKKDGKKMISVVEADQKILDAVKPEHEATIAYMNQQIGETTAPIFSYFASATDDPSVQIVNMAQIDYIKTLVQGTEYEGLPILSAAAPFKAGGRGGSSYYTNIPKGPIALKNVADLYVYPNTLDVVKLTGAQVVEWLEMSAQAFNQIDINSQKEQPLLEPNFPSYNFDVIDGISYEIDLTQPARYNTQGELVSEASHRIVNVMFNGKKIDLSAPFLIGTNNYRGSGGGKFPGVDGSSIVISAPDENRTIVSNYLQKEKSFNPTADKNWKFVNNLKDAYVTFKTGSGAKEFLNDSYPFTYDKDLTEGFIQLKLKSGSILGGK